MAIRRYFDEVSGGAERFWRMMEERSRATTAEQRAAIDELIWEVFGEDWAVVFTDLAGFSRGAAGGGLLRFLEAIYRARVIFTPLVAEHGGVELKTEGDSLMLIFRNPSKAVSCTVSLQQACQRENLEHPERDELVLKAGVAYGAILRIGDTDAYGQAVNSASRLGEDTARSHEILVTEDLRREAGELADISYEPYPMPANLPNEAAVYSMIYPRVGI